MKSFHPNQLRPTQHNISRPGSYFSHEGDLSIAYGDGTPEPLAEACVGSPSVTHGNPADSMGCHTQFLDTHGPPAEPTEPGAGEPDTTSVSEATGTDEEQ